MKKLIKTLSVAIFAALIFTACSSDNSDYKDMYEGFVTVENPDSTTTFYLITDNALRLLTTTEKFIPAHRVRLFARFAIDEKMPEGSEYDYKVELISCQGVMTKNIFNITPETQDSIGNDPIEIRDLWIASDYLNVEFVIYYYNINKHYFNLVTDTSRHYNDDALHFELRHNANNDYPYEPARGYASFDILPLRVVADSDSLNLVIHSKEYGSGEKTRTIVYKFSPKENKIRKLENCHNSPNSSAFFK